MRGLKPWAALAVLVSCLGALAAAFQPPPPPTRWATDTVGFLSESTRRALDARLQKYEQDTGRQVIVWIGSTTGGVPLEEWAARTFEAWGIGKKGRDDGVAVFVFAGERKIRIEVGYGLEPVVPDAIASRIIQQEAIPRLQAGEPDAAVSATVDALLRTLGGETSPPPPTAGLPERPLPREIPTAQKIFYGLLALALLIFVSTHPRLAFYLLLQILSNRGNRRGGGGWGGSSGGGSFRGGGGRSGGGGASGSW